MIALHILIKPFQKKILESSIEKLWNYFLDTQFPHFFSKKPIDESHGQTFKDDKMVG